MTSLRETKLELGETDLWYLDSLCKDELKRLKSRTDLTTEEKNKSLEFLKGLKSRLEEL